MLDEERNTGAVKWHVYRDYAKDVGSWGFVIGILGMHVMAQVCQVGNSLFLGFWAGDELGLRMGEYMAIYAGFGGAIAIFVVSLDVQYDRQKRLRLSLLPSSGPL